MRPQILRHRQVDIHFVQVVKSYSRHPKTSTSIKNWMSRSSAIPILSSYGEYNKELRNAKNLKRTKLTTKENLEMIDKML